MKIQRYPAKHCPRPKRSAHHGKVNVATGTQYCANAAANYLLPGLGGKFLNSLSTA